MKKILLTMGAAASIAAPIATAVSCGSETTYDLFIFTGKAENIAEFRKAADAFNVLYKEEYGKTLNIRIDGAGNGVDYQQALATRMIKSEKPDVVTSFGVGEVKTYVDNNMLLEIESTDTDLAWTNTASIAHADTQVRLNEDLSLPTDDTATAGSKQWGLALNYEAVGPVVNLATLGTLYPDGDDSTTPAEDGRAKYDGILANGISWTDYLAMKALIEVDNSTEEDETPVVVDKLNNVFANATKKNEVEWISGFHMVNNFMSTRNTANGKTWSAYSNTYATFENGLAYGTGNSKNPLEVMGTDSDKVVEALYNEYYGEGNFAAADGNGIDYDKSFGAFRDGSALLTHASTGMHSWVAGDGSVVLDVMAPFPMPLQTVDGVYGEAGTDTYNDIPVSNGMLWHLVDNGDDDRAKLTKDFLRYVSTGEFVKEDGTVTLDTTGAALFYNSTLSQLVNPYAGTTAGISGQDLTSEVITAQIKGQSWDSLSGAATGDESDKVTLWSNGALSPWSDETLGYQVLENVGKANYTMNMDAAAWNKFKERLVIK